ncbi:MAG: M14 family metallocarboxypeptidase [Clostridia bacterium]|nr:M14 family metallocarboxypeptidase [Clostridia bacterium]
MDQTNRLHIDLHNPFDYATLLQKLRQLEQTYSFFDFSYLGTTILDRGIPIVKLGHGKRAILYVGAHHGMEWITSTVLIKFLGDFCEATACNRAVNKISAKAVCETHTLYIIPMLNPDGVEYQINGISEDNPLYERLLAMNGGSTNFSNWQANARGVDLNHNYDAGFWEYKKLETEHQISEGAPTRYSGKAPESEPEVRALCDFIRYHTELRGVITLHTQGKEIFYRSGKTELPRTRVTAAHLARLSGYRLSDADGLASFGGLTDWCVQKMNLPSFTVECGSGKNPLPHSDLSQIYFDLRNMLYSFPMLL